MHMQIQAQQKTRVNVPDQDIKCQYWSFYSDIVLAVEFSIFWYKRVIGEFIFNYIMNAVISYTILQCWEKHLAQPMQHRLQALSFLLLSSEVLVAWLGRGLTGDWAYHDFLVRTVLWLALSKTKDPGTLPHFPFIFDRRKQREIHRFKQLCQFTKNKCWLMQIKTNNKLSPRKLSLPY